MTVKRAREILGDEIADMTDEEVREMNYTAIRLINIVVEHVSRTSNLSPLEFYISP